MQELHNNGGKISILWNQEIEELKENLETKILRIKYIALAQCLDQDKQELQNQFACLWSETTPENKHMALDDWNSQVVA